MSLLTRAAVAADRPALLELFREAFGEEPDAALFRWKYEEGPHPAPSAVAVLQGCVVGHYGAIGTRYVGSGRAIPGAAAADVMTSRRGRGLGHRSVFAELGEAFSRLQADRGVPFYFGFPNQRHSLVSERLLGTKPLERAGLLTVATRSEARPAGLLGRLRRRLLRVAEGARVSAAHDALAEVLAERPGLRTDRSRAVLDWRLARPGTSYRVLELLDPLGRSLGYAALRVLPDRLLAVDLQLRDEGDGTLVDLLDAIHERLGRLAPRLQVRLPRGGALASRLRQELGFRDEESDTCYEVRLLPAAGRPDVPLGWAASLDYRFLDHEIF